MRSFFLAAIGVCSLFATAVLLLPSASGSAAPSSGSAGAEQHWSIASNEVIAEDDDCTDNTGFAIAGVTGTANCLHYYSSVHLPDGAVVTKMEVFYDDGVDPANAVFTFSYSDLPMESGEFGTDFRVDTTGTPGKTSTTVAGTETIDNGLNHYGFGMNLPVGIIFYSAVLTYTTPAGGAANANGDVDCDGDLTSRDNQALLRHVLSQPALSQTEPCPDVGA